MAVDDVLTSLDGVTVWEDVILEDSLGDVEGVRLTLPVTVNNPVWLAMVEPL